MSRFTSLTAGTQRFSFVVFTTTIDESAHTDRVIADRWEVAGVLVDGDVDDELLATTADRGARTGIEVAWTRGS